MRILFKKIFIVAAAVIVIQIFTGLYYYPSELLDVMAGNNCFNNIVYLGDSTIKTCDPSDTDRRSISKILGYDLGKKIVSISHGAYHLGVYKDFVTYLSTHNTPSTVIIPINMRSFSTQWDLNPGQQFEKESFLLEKGVFWSPLYKPVSIYTSFFNDSLSKSAWRNMKVYDYGRYAGTVSEFENISYETVSPQKIRNKIVFHYRYQLRPNHRKLIALDAICKQSKRNNIRVVFYITPIDNDYIDSAYKGTAQIIQKNVAVVKGVISQNGLSVIDMSSALPSCSFGWKVDKYPNEHLNEQGRKYVARTLANALTAH
jgi:hypothetical protein